MINGYFNIEVCYIDEGDDLIHFNVYISNIISSTIIEYWEYKDEFKKFANELMNFPKNINDKIIFNGGNKDIEFQEYFQILVFCYDLTGHSALKVLYKNNLQDAYEHQCIFSILTEPASLNQFAFALNKWNPLEALKFEWEFVI